MAEFQRALAQVQLTMWRRQILRAYAANPDGLTIVQLGRLLRKENAKPHSVGNVANAGFARAFASKLGFAQGKRKTWWVGVTFEISDVLSALGHSRFHLVEPLRLALSKDRGDWGRTWREGKDHGPHVAQEIEPEPARRVASRLARDRQPAFRKRLLALYKHKCAVTACSIEAALEACHIDRYAEKPNNDLDNGLVLRADLHRLFDAGLMLLSEKQGKLHVRVHPGVADKTFLRSFDGRQLKFEPDSHRPNRSGIKRHERTARKRANWPTG